jgi:hypothetical protein
MKQAKDRQLNTRSGDSLNHATLANDQVGTSIINTIRAVQPVK